MLPICRLLKDDPQGRGHAVDVRYGRAPTSIATTALHAAGTATLPSQLLLQTLPAELLGTAFSSMQPTQEQINHARRRESEAKFSGWGASETDALVAIAQEQGEAELRYRAMKGEAPTHEV